MFEFFLWCAALGREFLRIIVTQLVQREATARGDLQRVDKRFRPGAEEVRHLRRALQGALGFGLEAVAGPIDGAVLADASDGVEQWLAAGCAHAHVVASGTPYTELLRPPRQRAESPVVVAMGERAGSAGNLTGKCLGDTVTGRLGTRRP